MCELPLSIDVIGGYLNSVSKYIEITWVPCYCDIMIQSFKNRATEDIFNGISSKIARRACPQRLWKISGRKFDQIDSVITVEELRIPPGNKLEALSGKRRGQYSIRINDQYRICFEWSETGPFNVEITDYH